MKMADEIITELWKGKVAIAEEYGCDVKALVAHLERRDVKKTTGLLTLDL